MSARRPEGNRDVIPRWREPRNAAARAELAPLTESIPRPVDQSGLHQRESDWREHGTLGFAFDLVGTSLLVGSSPQAKEAARAILDTSGTSGLSRLLARRVLGEQNGAEPPAPLGGSSELEVRQQIHDLRDRLASDPRNTLGWTEMARYYTILGQREQASRAMQIALNLMPEHRYVLRAASRLAVHHGDFEYAHAVVARAERTPYDPWLVAAELAAAGPAGVRPKLTKQGRRMLEGGGFSARTTTELASALGTLEFRAGSARRARRLFEASLEFPNDNAIAQGEWISRHLSSIEIDPLLLNESAEARALRSGEAMEVEKALKAAWEWHRDQPFASGPGELGSFQASAGGAYKEGVEIAEAARIANPDEFLLANNLAFCLLNLGKITRAAEVLSALEPGSLEEHEVPTFLATLGLLHFRSGDAEEGRALYGRSIRLARDPHDRAVAKIMRAAEERRLRSPDADELVREALAAGREAEGADLALWLKRLPPD